MSVRRNEQLPPSISIDDIVVQDAVSLLNLSQGFGERTTLKTVKNRIKVTEQKSSGNVFDACRMKAPEFLCTFNETKKKYVTQHSFSCSTCNLVGNEGLCTICVNVCHKGHDLRYRKNEPFFCDCGIGSGSSKCKALTGKGETDSLLCTFKETGVTNRTQQHFFHCTTCLLVGRKGLCTACVAVCHKGHDVTYGHFSQSFFCDCGSSGNCQALTF